MVMACHRARADQTEGQAASEAHEKARLEPGLVNEVTD